MKNKIAHLSIAVLLSLASPTSKVMADEGKKTLDFTTSFIISPGYHDFVQSHYSSVSGIGGWFGVGAGIICNLNEQTTLTPGVDFLINAIQMALRGF